MDAVCGKIRKTFDGSINMVWNFVTLYILPVRRDMMPDGYDPMKRQANPLLRRAFPAGCPA
jgi:hypothetical protein